MGIKYNFNITLSMLCLELLKFLVVVNSVTYVCKRGRNLVIRL
jgi:hypothetical protein